MIGMIRNKFKFIHILWFSIKSSESTVPIIRSERFIKPDANNITFVQLNKNDFMVLQCNASNIHGYVFSDVYLNILGKCLNSFT